MISHKEISAITFGSLTNRILLIDDDYYYIEEDYLKYDDVTRMPSYICNDWVKYNKKLITLPVLNKHLHNANELDEELRLHLLTIRRELFIDKIIK